MPGSSTLMSIAEKISDLFFIGIECKYLNV